MSASPRHRRVLRASWIDPVAVAAGLRDRDGLLALVSDGGDQGRTSWIAAEPEATYVGPADPAAPFQRLRKAGWSTGVACLASYDLGARPATGPREGAWPDLMLARYASMLRFDHARQVIEAIGLGDDAAAAGAAAGRALAWTRLAREPEVPGGALSSDFSSEAAPETYCEAVRDVVQRIAQGELFQANVARAWSGSLRRDAAPFDLLARLARGRASAFGALIRLGDHAIVSNSPELFLTLDTARRIVTRPIKGTRRREADPEQDAAAARALQTAAKDRAENLMIVDLMRNDLSRVAEPGSVRVDRLFEIESHPTVHHLVSTVSGQLADGHGPADLLEACFPPGSITGAPKHQAMKVIAAHEPPRGPWCGSLIWLDDQGGLSSSVLIRTAAFRRTDGLWRYRTLAGAGIVADSDPGAELAETEAKILAIREALTG